MRRAARKAQVDKNMQRPYLIGVLPLPGSVGRRAGSQPGWSLGDRNLGRQRQRRLRVS